MSGIGGTPKEIFLAKSAGHCPSFDPEGSFKQGPCDFQDFAGPCLSFLKIHSLNNLSIMEQVCVLRGSLGMYW